MFKFVSSCFRFYGRLFVSLSDRSLTVGTIAIFAVMMWFPLPTIASHKVLHTLKSVFSKTF